MAYGDSWKSYDRKGTYVGDNEQKKIEEFGKTDKEDERWLYGNNEE